MKQKTNIRKDNTDKNKKQSLMLRVIQLNNQLQSNLTIHNGLLGINANAFVFDSRQLFH